MLQFIILYMSTFDYTNQTFTASHTWHYNIICLWKKETCRFPLEYPLPNLPLTVAGKVSDTIPKEAAAATVSTNRPRRSQPPTLPLRLHLLTLLIRTPRSRGCPPAIHASPSLSYSILLAMNSRKQTKLQNWELQGNQPVRTYIEQLMILTSCPCSCFCLRPKEEASPRSLGLWPYIPRYLLPALEVLICSTEHKECTGMGSVNNWFRDTHPVDLVSTSTSSMWTCRHPPQRVTYQYLYVHPMPEAVL